MVQHYYGDMNKNVKQVFAKVHFTLFYVAIINALMSCLLYFCAMHFANKHWIRLETVDVDHYVAIRKKFDALEEQLNNMNVLSDGNNTLHHSAEIVFLRFNESLLTALRHFPV